MQRKIVPAFALLVWAGCTTTASVRPSELARLDGYDVRREPFTEPVLETIDGEPVALDADSRIFLNLRGARVGGRFAAIDVRDGVFEGRTDSALPIRAPIADIHGATVERPNNVGTILWGVGGLLVAGMVTLIVVGLFANVATPLPGVHSVFAERSSPHRSPTARAGAAPAPIRTCRRCRPRHGRRWRRRGSKAPAPNMPRCPRSRGCR